MDVSGPKENEQQDGNKTKRETNSTTTGTKTDSNVALLYQTIFSKFPINRFSLQNRSFCSNKCLEEYVGCNWSICLRVPSDIISYVFPLYDVCATSM